MKNKEISFEEALEGLKESAESITLKNNSLEDAITTYNKGLEYYNICKSILENSKQSIEVINK